MKSFGFCVLFLLFMTTLVCLAKTITCSPPDTAFAMDKQGITVTATSRKLKDFGKGPMSKGHLNLEDYGPNDPSPTTKATIRPGPIQHAAPYIPYIPKPSRPAAPPGPPAPPAPLEPDHPKLGALP